MIQFSKRWIVRRILPIQMNVKYNGRLPSRHRRRRHSLLRLSFILAYIYLCHHPTP